MKDAHPPLVWAPTPPLRGEETLAAPPGLGTCKRGREGSQALNVRKSPGQLACAKFALGRAVLPDRPLAQWGTGWGMDGMGGGPQTRFEPRLPSSGARASDSASSGAQLSCLLSGLSGACLGGVVKMEEAGDGKSL